MNNKVLLGLIFSIISAITLFNSQNINLQSPELDNKNTYIKDSTLYAKYNNKGLKNDDLIQIMDNIYNVYYNNEQGLIINEFIIDLSQNSISNACPIIKGLQKITGNAKISLNLSQNSIRIPTCSKYVYGTKYELDLSNNQIDLQGYLYLQKLEYRYYRSDFSLNLSNNGPLPSGVFDFLNSYENLENLTLILDNLEIYPRTFLKLRYLEVRNKLSISIKNSNLDNFGYFLNSFDPYNVKYLQLDLANNNYSEDSDFNTLNRFIKLSKNFIELRLNLYGNSQLSQSFVDDQLQPKKGSYYINLNDPEFDTFSN